jgi:2-C-methyl-D-erythritol 4-phosphate cytidylyltransferase
MHDIVTPGRVLKPFASYQCTLQSRKSARITDEENQTMHRFTVCIPAAGSGTRMKSDEPKQYLTIAGAPVLLHTLAVFDAIDECRRIVIATDDREKIRSVLSQCEWRVDIDIVLGGERRQDSVEKALSAVEKDKEIVLVHDAARPCVKRSHIAGVVEAVARHDAAVLAIPARDTLKHVENGVIIETVDRALIWQAQTPQGARAGIFREAFTAATRDGFEATDDMSLLERIGVQVHVVSGSASNLKITEPEDLLLAEAILTERQHKQDKR